MHAGSGLGLALVFYAVVAAVVAHGPSILLETGDFLLMETGDRLLLE